MKDVKDDDKKRERSSMNCRNCARKMPLVKNLVELHGGKFSVESEGQNKGTSVRFTLPIISRRVV